MEDIQKLVSLYIDTELIQVIISNPRQKDGVKKIHIRPVLLHQNLVYQVASYTEKQVFHQNLSSEDCISLILKSLDEFKQIQIESQKGQVSLLVSKKGKITSKVKESTGASLAKQDLSHNRKKKYLLDPEVRVPFLQDLGVQTAEGRIVQSRYDKFRQINRFLEFVEDVADKLPRDREAVIIDFGCGKSYLTFAMYYYLHELKGLEVKMIGLDLKEDVIARCNQLRTNYGYDHLDFFVGDIADYQGVDQVDMVVTLHACDTATDYALYKAIKWNASVILSVPCCQHEFNKTIHHELLDPILRYGLVKERTAALFTDAFRADMLEEYGYQVQLLEFIDMEHTPKNILIRAVKEKGRKIGLHPYQKSYQALGADLTLYHLLHDKEKEEAE